MSDSVPSANISLDQLLGNALDGVFAVDRQRRYVLFNEACERITGFRAADLLGRSCQCADVLDCQDDFGRSLSGVLCPARILFEGIRDTARQRMQIRRPDGSTVWIETIYSTVRDGNKEVELVLGVMRDVNEAKAKEDEILAQMSQLRERIRHLGEQQKAIYGFDNIVSKSPAMVPIFQRIRAALKNLSPVLISGESGVGKEIVARTIHTNGLHHDGPFLPFSCTSSPRDLIESELFGHTKDAFNGAVQDCDGLLRAAEGGTVFIDEITDMPVETQAKLLRVLEEKRVVPVGGTEQIPVHFRIIAATNHPPREAVARGKLRKDLFYRLNVIGIDLPPLIQRSEDIPILVESFIEEFNKIGLRQIREVAPAAWQRLLAYPWPGNIRELANAIESAFALGDGPVLRREDFPPEVLGRQMPPIPRDTADALRLDPHLEQLERDAIRRALRAANWKRNKAAKLMGISRSRLYRRMEALGIDPSEHL